MTKYTQGFIDGILFVCSHSIDLEEESMRDFEANYGDPNTKENCKKWREMFIGLNEEIAQTNHNLFTMLSQFRKNSGYAARLEEMYDTKEKEPTFSTQGAFPSYEEIEKANKFVHFEGENNN